MKHFQSDKIHDHTTLIDAADQAVRQLDKMDWVSRISLGFITSGLRPVAHRVKFKPLNGGITAVVRGSTSVQEIRIYTSRPNQAKSLVKRLVEKKH